MVLRPNKRAEHCSLALDYSMPISPQVAPLLVIEVANPRVLALFRYLAVCNNSRCLLDRMSASEGCHGRTSCLHRGRTHVCADAYHLACRICSA